MIFIKLYFERVLDLHIFPFFFFVVVFKVFLIKSWVGYFYETKSNIQALLFITTYVGSINNRVKNDDVNIGFQLSYFLIQFPPLNSFRTVMYCDFWPYVYIGQKSQTVYRLRPVDFRISKKNSFRENYMRKYGNSKHDNRL